MGGGSERDGVASDADAAAGSLLGSVMEGFTGTRFSSNIERGSITPGDVLAVEQLSAAGDPSCRPAWC